MKYIKRSIIFLVPLITVGLIGFEIGKRQTITLSGSDQLTQSNNQPVTEDTKFPPLKMPIEYFDTKGVSMGASENGMSYEVISDADAFRSYPTTAISLESGMYSSTPADLPPIKTDEEIHEKDLNLDFFGSIKQANVLKYGDLGRRFVGSAGIGTEIYKVRFVDVDKDGKNETILSICETGANILAQWDVIIKGDKIIFSTSEGSFSTLIPAKNGNGFFMQWNDNFKNHDGYVTTRFVYDGEKFTPVYEQLTRYIRVSTK